MLLSNVSIKRPVFASVIMLALATLGIASYRRLAVELMPNVEIPVITIVTVLPGASPDTVEREVSKKIEEAVNPIAGVRHVMSTSREGVSQVVVEFELEVKTDQVVQDARTKIAAIRGDLPAAIEDPIIEKIDIGGIPIISLAVRSSSLSPRDLTTLVETRIQPRLENLLGVGKVDLVGPATREISVEVQPDRLEALGMGIDEVIAGLRSENIDTPLGRMNSGGREVPLRVQGRAESVDEFRRMVIATRGPRLITLDDVAEVTDSVEEVRSLALVNGTRAVALDLLKQSGANATGVADAVKAEVAALQPELPPGTAIEVVRDSSVYILESVRDVQETLVIGGFLTVLIVFVFLNSWRSTVITGLTLPISVISSFIIMNFGGLTLNVMTLMALSLAIGLLIDDAIVVRENIVRHLEHGEDHFEAARNGTSEIGLAVMATTGSVLAVFVPVAFMEGIVGRFFFAFGITVAFAVAVSLLVSFTLDPMLSSRWVDPDITRTGRRHLLARLLDHFNRWFDATADRYRGLIARALDHRVVVIGLAVAAFVTGVAILGLLQKEFFPPTDQAEFVVSFRAAPDASIDETRGRLDEVLATLREYPEVVTTYASIGAGDAGTVRDARVYVKLTPKAERARAQNEIERDLRRRLLKVPGIIASIVLADSMNTQKPLIVDVRGDDIQQLKAYAQRLKEAMYQVPGIVDLEATLEHDVPEYRLIVDRQKAADAGLTTMAIAQPIASLVGGQTVTTFEDEAGESRDVRVRLPAGLRQNASQLEGLRLSVRGPDGAALIPVGSVARYQLSTAPSEINRMDLSRQVEIGGNMEAGLPLGTAAEKVTEIASRLDLQPGYSVVIGGENEIMVESFGYMFEALVLAIVFVYLILAAQFESFIDPLAIMLSLPLSIVGMAAMLLMTGDTLNVMSLIGLIMLMGLVTKNAILLVDYTKVLRRRGLERRAAIIQAGRTRLRPIVMTTSAMIFGMLPLALGFGSGGEMRAPMARAVIGGLVTSTLLTLIVVPVVYSLLDDLGAWILRRRRHAQPAATTAAVALALSFVVPARPCAAQQPSAPAGGARILTLPEALAIADRQNYDVEKARQYQDWVHGKYVEERSAAMPSVSFGGTALRQFDDTQSKLFRNFSFGDAGASGSEGPEIGEIFGGRQDVRVAELRVSQVLFTWGQVGAGIRAARVGYKLADAQLNRSQQTTTRDVATAYYDVIAAKDLVALAGEDLAQKERHLAEARRRATAGAATDYEILSAEVAADNARPALIRAQNLVRTQKERLKWLLAERAGEIDVAPLPPVVVGAPPVYEAVLQSALQHRPELTELASQRAIYKELVTIAQAASRPRIDFSAGLGTRNLGLPSLSSTGRTWNAAITASIPVFDSMKTRGRVAQARTDLSRAEIDERKVRDGVALEVRVAVDALAEAAEILSAIGGTVRQAERLLFLSEKGYELGVKTSLDVQDAQLNLLLARTNLARAQRDYRVARVSLEWVAGTLDASKLAP